jgi:hypothetical protein
MKVLETRKPERLNAATMLSRTVESLHTSKANTLRRASSKGSPGNRSRWRAMAMASRDE